MREIKFRWWDTEHKTMVTDIAIHPKYNWLVLADNDAMAESSYKEGILMQYTGLLDRNGKEIYEGDIIRSIYMKLRPKEVKWTYMRGSVGWGIGKGQLYEVIGNIFQNPDLLSKTELAKRK